MKLPDYFKSNPTHRHTNNQTDYTTSLTIIGKANYQAFYVPSFVRNHTYLSLKNYSNFSPILNSIYL